MGDQQSKDGPQDVMNPQQFQDGHDPYSDHGHRTSNIREYQNNNTLSNNHLFDSGGESDAYSSSSSSGTRPKYQPRPGTGRWKSSSKISLQSSQMSNFSSSVPDVSRTGLLEEHNRFRDIRQPGGDITQKLDYLKSNGIGPDRLKEQQMAVDSSPSNLQKRAHFSANHATFSQSKKNLSYHTTHTISQSNREQNVPLFQKKQTEDSTSGLLDSQRVLFGSSSVRHVQQSDSQVSNNKPEVGKIEKQSKGTSGLPSNINYEDAWKQFQQMQQDLQQLKQSSKQILQEMDSEERENEELVSVINEKASGIESRLQRIEEKSLEDEATLMKLTDLVKAICAKFDDLESMMKTLSSDNIDSNAENVGPETSNAESREADVPTVNEGIHEVGVNIDRSSLPEVTKDNKGYKDRQTVKKDDNRHQLRKERRTKKKRGMKPEAPEQRTNKEHAEVIPNSSETNASNTETKNSSQKIVRKKPSKHSVPSVESTDSLLDSRDDYRNLAVLASGKKVLPSVEHDIINDVGAYWTGLASKEKIAAERSTLQKGKGAHTYLILDTSSSMEGQPFASMIQAAKAFIRGICDNMLVTDENLCIVEVGLTTRVLVHLTKNRDNLLSALGQLRPGGMSPIMGALLVVKDLLTLHNSNIVVISDGKMTPIHIKAGQDLPDLDNEQLKIQLTLISHGFKEVHCRVSFVHVGPYDSSMMEVVVKETGGVEVDPTNIQRLCNWTRNKLVMLKLMDDIRQQKPGAVVDHEQLKHLVEELGSSVGPDEMDDMLKIAADNEQTKCDFIECDPNMPPLGTRVRRGPDWKWNNQDIEMPGTIVSHTKNGHIWVEWDYGSIYRYRYGAGGWYDVVTTEDPRLLQDDLIIAVGCVVRRGDGWLHGHTEDGGLGKTGSVFVVHDNGSVQVRWSNGNIGRYKFGQDGCYEVEICDPLQHRLEPMAATGGGHMMSYTESKSDEEDVDPMVAEMNRKNASISKLKSETSDNVKKDKSKDRTSEAKSTGQQEIIRKQKKSTTQENDVVRDAETAPLRLRDGSDVSKTTDNISGSPRTQTRLKLDVNSSESDGHPETLIPGVKIAKPEITIEQEGRGIWQYKDAYSGWKSYDKEHNDKLEKGYCHHPNGASLLQIGKSSYRILFSKFKQVNTKTKEMIDIRRLLPTT